MLGERIKELRKTYNLKISDLSLKSGVARSTISEIESGVAIKPKCDTLAKLAKALGVTIDDLIFDTGNNNDNEKNRTAFKDMTLEDVTIYLKSSTDKNLTIDDKIQLLLWLEELQELRCFKNRILNAIDNKSSSK